MKHSINKTMNIKKISLALAISAGALFSVNASAEQTVSLEEAISQFVINQGHQMIAELNVQISQSITDEVEKISNRFTSNEVLAKQLSEKNEPLVSMEVLKNHISQVEE